VTKLTGAAMDCDARGKPTPGDHASAWVVLNYTATKIVGKNKARDLNDLADHLFIGMI